MNGIPTRSLLEEIDKSAFEHAIFLTYGIDLPFFEDSILRSLLRQEARNVAVFADGRHAAGQLRHLAEMKKDRSGWHPCGKFYSLTPVRHQTAFHPKVALLVGEEVQLWIGSGNLEPGGLRSNLEIHNIARFDPNGIDEPGIPAMIANIWGYIRGIAEMNSSEVVRQQLNEVEESIPWVRTSKDGKNKDFRLVLGPEDDAIKIIANEIGNEKIDRVIIVSPFFDKDFRTLKSLMHLFDPKKVQILIQPDKTSMHGPTAEKLNGVDFYKLRAPNDRYAHAKIILLEGRKREIVFSGSHNLSERGMKSENYETSILQTGLNPGQILSYLKLDQDIVDSNRVNKSDLAAMSIIVRENEEDATGTQILSSAEITNYELTLRLRQETRAKNIILLVYDDSTVPKKYGRVQFNGLLGSVKVSPENVRDWVAVAIETDGKASAPVPILHVTEMFTRISKQRKFRDLANRASRTGTGLDDIEELVEDLRSVLFDEWRLTKVGRKIADDEDGLEKTETRQLSYEDFIIPLKREHESENSPVGNTRSTFDAVLGAILASLGGTKAPLASETNTEDADIEQIPDDLSSLADSSAEEEERLASEATNAEGEISFDDEEGSITSGEHSEQVTDKSAKKDTESQTKIAERYARKFKKMARCLPGQMRSRLEGDRSISIYEVEVLLTSARLFTGLVGRVQKIGDEEVVYLGWEDWAEVQAGLLDVLTTNRLKVLSRIPWNRVGHAALRELHSGLAGWCLCIRGYLNTPAIKDNTTGKTRMRIRVGLRLAGQLLGIEREKLSKEDVLKAAHWLLGHRAPDTSEPPLHFDEWCKEIGKLRTDDLRLRNIYKSASDIAESKIGLLTHKTGAWVWWPHIDGHIGLLCSDTANHFEILYEVNESKKIMPGYVVELSANS